jgi:site-specific DNA-cytosine methylase
MNVLSLFDGMSCGQQALKMSGIKVDNYLASEIDESAIKVAKMNFPNTQHVGSVVGLLNFECDSDIPHIDLLIGGSPCQGFSFAGGQLAFDDPRSVLFFEYVRILKQIRKKNPNVFFLLENVNMKKKFRDVISSQLGVEPIAINSSLLVAQNRPRLYWTNIPSVTIPNDTNTVLEDVLEKSEVYHKFYLSAKAYDYMGRLRNGKERWYFHQNPLKGKAACLTANMWKGVPYGVIRELGRRLTPTECERLQGLPDGYTKCVSNTQRYKMIGNGWTVPIISHILDNLKPLF